jgi:hypothetical protein
VKLGLETLGWKIPTRGEFDQEKAKLLEIQKPSADELAKLALLLSSPRDGSMPSEENDRLAYRFAKQWKRSTNGPRSSGTDYAIPAHLYINLACKNNDYQDADSELSKLGTETRIQYIDWYIGSEVVSGKLPSAKLIPDKLDLAVAETIAAALSLRRQHGREEPQPELSMADLVNELADVAWECYKEEYIDNGMTKEDIVAVPDTEETFLEYENRVLGRMAKFFDSVSELPQDYKELIRVTKKFVSFHCFPLTNADSCQTICRSTLWRHARIWWCRLGSVISSTNRVSRDRGSLYTSRKDGKREARGDLPESYAKNERAEGIFNGRSWGGG